jgi:hypothetical protein
MPIFVENFDRWLTEDDDAIHVHQENHNYVLDCKRGPGSYLTWMGYDLRSYDEFSLRTKVRARFANSDSYYGIVWGLTDVNNFYCCLINPRGQYLLSKSIDDHDQHLSV